MCGFSELKRLLQSHMEWEESNVSFGVRLLIKPIFRERKYPIMGLRMRERRLDPNSYELGLWASFGNKTNFVVVTVAIAYMAICICHN